MTLLALLFTNNGNAQDCAYLSKANDINPLGKCAPVDVDWQVVYRGVDDKGSGNVQIQYDWDDGNPVEVINATLTDVPSKEWTTNHSHIYPNTGNLCNYHPRVSLIVNGIVCTSSVQEQMVTVWDTDNKNGGELSIDPPVKPICIGNDALFHFTDASQWNCTPPDENDVINNENRWIQWIYGTGSTTINDAEVDGAVRAYPWVGSINYISGPVEAPVAPYNTSLDIYIPDHHPIGAFFEVTLRNWNTCNPYDDPDIAGPPTDLINGDYDPVTITAMAIIVALPDASIQSVPPVCESADPFLLISADGGGQWNGPGISSPGSAIFDPKLAGPGVHTISYSITDGNGCSDIGYVNITVLESPKANIIQNSFTNLCPGITLDLNGDPSLGLPPYTHSWKGDTAPLSSTSIVNPDFSTMLVNQYELIYKVEDANTCWDEDTITVDVEEVNIDFDNGNIETCIDTNILLDPKPVGGSETFISHQWTGTRLDKITDSNIQTPIFTADEVGIFQYEYTVKDSYGCEDTETITITVHQQPISDAGIDINECDLQTILSATPSVGDGLWKVIDGPGTLTFEDFTIENPNIASDTYGTYHLRWTENNNSCQDSADINVSFTEIPTPSVMEDKDTCGTSIQLIAFPHIGTGQWTKTEGVGNASFNYSDHPITTVTVNTPGTYKFAWAEDNGNNCKGSDTVTIQFFKIPVASITPPPTVSCTPLNIQFNNTSDYADSYYWDFGNGFISNEENPQQVFTNNTPSAVDYNIKLISRTIEGCADTIETSIKVAPTPIAHFEANNIIGCSPLNTDFTNKSQGGDSYKWTFNDSSPMETTKDPSHSFYNIENFVQSFEVMLVTENSFSCTDTSRLFTTVYPKQDFNLTATPDSGCSPLNITFIADPGGYKYGWDLGDGTIINGVNQNNKLFINETNAKENHTIKLYTTSFYGCIDTTETAITVLPSPTALFEPNDFAVCSPKKVLFTNHSLNTDNSHWSFGDGNSASTVGTTPIEHTYTNIEFLPKYYKIRLVTENNFGCKDSMDGFTNVNPAIKASISGDTTNCTPFNMNFGNETIGATSYVWDYGDGNTSSGFYGKNIFNNDTNEEIKYDVSMIASSAYGCSDTAHLTATALPAPKTYFEPNDFTVCSPKRVIFTNYTENITKSHWSFGDGTITTNDGAEIIEHTYLNDMYTPLDYRIRLITENSFGCKDSMDGYTSVNPKVQAIIMGSGEGCSPTEVSIGNESIGANNFLWNYGDGNTSSGYLGLNLFKNNGHEDTEYSVSMIASSTYGCSDTAYTSVTVYATPEADFTVTPDYQQMPESTVDINNITNGDQWSYLWNFGDKNSSDLKQPGNHTYIKSGEFTISLKAYSDKCENTFEKSIQIMPNIPIVEYGPPTKGCPSLKVDFYSNTVDAESFLWEFGDGNISSDANPSHTYYTEGRYGVKLTVTGPGGQTIKDDLEINVFPEPMALFEVFPKVVTIPGQAVSFANKSIGANIFNWNFGDSNTSTEVNPVYEYTTPGNFDVSLQVSNEYGCMDEYVQNEAVTAQEGGNIEFPNAFTPNPNGSGNGEYIFGDKNNYVFYPAIQEGVVEYKMQIFSRWGQLIFESNDIKIGWNGYHRNKICSQGVYIWKVTCRFSTGQLKVYTGDVTLLR